MATRQRTGTRRQLIKEWPEATIFTTGQLSAITGVSVKSICDWMEKGILPHFKVPCAAKARPQKIARGRQYEGDRRVYKSDLITFLQKHGMYETLALIRPKPYLVSCGVESTKKYTAPLAKYIECYYADTLIGMGFLLRQYRPDVAVIDTCEGMGDTLTAIRAMKGNPLLVGTKWVVFYGADDNGDTWKEEGCVEAFQHPLDPYRVSISLMKHLPVHSPHNGNAIPEELPQYGFRETLKDINAKEKL